MKYVLKEKPTNKLTRSQGNYTGKTYVVQGERFCVFSEDITKAKKYSSRIRAENAVKSIYNWTCIYDLVVEEIEE